MSDAPPTKRRREDENAEEPITGSSDYWFDDGNIILQAESTQFRVAKSMLTKHSSVFRDMFTVPTPAGEPIVEGCHVVFLPGDTAKDWTHLLSVMYSRYLK
ncbi:BTB domain-containing protein [Mycena kentingensis (nom. inval.)]|nr:BTB domain-containing protein [Mycena kentingensis (nom. inval.)]